MTELNKIILSGLSSYVTSRVIRYFVEKKREKSGLPPLSARLPGTEVSLGLLSGLNESPWSPYVTGFILGKGIDTTENYLKSLLPPTQRGVEKSPVFSKGIEGSSRKEETWREPGWESWNIENFKLPSGLSFHLQRGKTYNQMAKLLKKFVISDTYNPKLKMTIPAGYRHPQVVYYAKKAVGEFGGDGHSAVSVGKCLTSWGHKYIPYVLDPSGEREDWYFHPAITLSEMEKSNFGLPVDCDDAAILVASMIKALGYEPAFMLWAYDDPSIFRHITVSIKVPKNEETLVKMKPYFNIDLTEKYKGYDYIPNYSKMAIIKVS